jgi:hypothetical protein
MSILPPSNVTEYSGNIVHPKGLNDRFSNDGKEIIISAPEETKPDNYNGLMMYSKSDLVARHTQRGAQRALQSQ